MKNYIKVLLTLVIVIALLTGCGTKTQMGLKISANKDVTIEYVQAYDDEYIEFLIDYNKESEAASGEVEEDIDDIQTVSGEVEDSGDGVLTLEKAYEALEEVELEEDPDQIYGYEFEGEIDDEEEVDDDVFAFSSGDISFEAISGESGEQGETAPTLKYTEAERWAFVDKELLAELLSGDQFKNYKHKRYSDEQYKGIKLYKKLGKIDDLLLEESGDILSFDDYDDSAKFFTKSGDTYSFKMTGADKENLESYKQYQESGLDVKLEFYITLPNKALSHNATSVSEDGRTYTWNLLDGNPIEIEFTLPENAGGSALPVVIGIVVVFVVFCVIASRSGKNEDSVEEKKEEE